MSGGSSTDSYDSSQGPYSTLTAGAHGNVTTNSNITLSGGQITGDATAGGTITVSGGGTITGQRTTGAAPVTFADQSGCSPYTGMTGVTPLSGGVSLSNNKLTISGGGSAALAPGSYCWAGITLSGGSVIQIASGPVTISLTGQANLSGGSIVNSTNEPSQVTLLSSYVATNNGVVLSGGSASYMVIYAPEAAVVFSGGQRVLRLDHRAQHRHQRRRDAPALRPGGGGDTDRHTHRHADVDPNEHANRDAHANAD
jgi:hypothetical protein